MLVSICVHVARSAGHRIIMKIPTLRLLSLIVRTIIPYCNFD